MSASDIYRKIPSKSLDSPCSDIHLAGVAGEMRRWEGYAPFFGISEVEEEEITRNYEHRYELQKRESLRTWKRKYGEKATYRELIRIFLERDNRKLAEMVSKLCQVSSSNDDSFVLNTYRAYLKDCYEQHPSPSSFQWPAMRKANYTDLILQQQPLEKKRGDIPIRCTLEINQVFTTDSLKQRRKVVLLEGVAGSGKTMLTWHASRMWAKGFLLSEVDLLIHVSLRDPHVHSANCLADIIPHLSKNIREEVAKVVAERNGTGVCFLFDGWDEVPHTVQMNSFLLNFIRGSLGQILPHCSIFVTSRPVASASLEPFLTEKIEIQGFSEDQVKKYITESGLEASTGLMKTLDSNPQLVILCMLPIMATIVVFLFSVCGGVLPITTHTDVFKVLVINLLLRHLDLRTSHTLGPVKEFTVLPDDILKRLRIISNVAFHGVINDKMVFGFEDLQELGVSSSIDTLGLMEANQQLTMFGPAQQYSFFHNQIQNFLAAYHMSELPKEEQICAVKEVLSKHPLSSALSVYAGLTKLKCREACRALLDICNKPLDFVAVWANLAQCPDEAADYRRLLLTLLRCIYEAQSPDICLLINPSASVPLLHAVTTLSFQGLKLQPADCHAIAYYVATTAPCKQIIVDLGNCSIQDVGVAIIMKLLQKKHEESKSCGVEFNFAGNQITHVGVQAISETLQMSSVIKVLYLGYNWHCSLTDINLALKYLIEGLSHNASCKQLIISNNSISAKHVYYLVLLLAFCKKVQILNFSSNNISKGFFLISAALKYLSSTRRLFIESCNICDKQLLDLGKAIQFATPLQVLVLNANPFTPTGFSNFLKCLLPPTLIEGQITLSEAMAVLSPLPTHLSVDFTLTQEHKQLVEHINRSRRRNIEKIMILSGTLCDEEMNIEQSDYELTVTNFYELQEMAPARKAATVARTVSTDLLHGLNSSERLYSSI